jgi:hypothetical protein
MITLCIETIRSSHEAGRERARLLTRLMKVKACSRKGMRKQRYFRWIVLAWVGLSFSLTYFNIIRRCAGAFSVPRRRSLLIEALYDSLRSWRDENVLRRFGRVIFSIRLNIRRRER